MSARRSTPPLFPAGAYHAEELGAEGVPELQRFFEVNPEYFFAVNGQPPARDEADEEIHGALPKGWPFTKKWIIGFMDDAASLVGMANVISDLLAPGVWHIGLFMIASRLQGSGTAQALYDELEHWTLDEGAQWLRLGVVQGNARAERFWESRAFVEVRKRDGVEMGAKVNTLRVMAKPLAGGSLAEYFALVARDRPEQC